MKRRKVICEKCYGEIESSEELVTDILVLSVVAYHEKCYGSDLKRGGGLILSGQPLNGWMGNATFILSLIFSIVVLISFQDWFLLFLVSLIPIVYRLYSYFYYERLLKK